MKAGIYVLRAIRQSLSLGDSIGDDGKEPGTPKSFIHTESHSCADPLL